VTSIGGASDPSDEVVALLLYFESSGLTNGQARSVLREVADAETAASTEL
jgi:serine/threonine-protein kinase HipA